MNLAVSPHLVIEDRLLRHAICGNRLSVSDNLLRLIAIIEGQITSEELRKQVASENLEEIIRLLLDQGFVIEVGEPWFYHISAVHFLRAGENSLFSADRGNLSQELDGTDETIGLIGLTYDKGSSTHQGAREAIGSIRRFSGQCGFLEVDGTGRTRGWFDPASGRSMLVGRRVIDYGSLQGTNNQALDLAVVGGIASAIAASRVKPVLLHEMSSPLEIRRKDPQ